MLAFLLRRLATTALLLWMVATATFFLIHLAPGEPARLFEELDMTQQARDELRSLYGLDQPLRVQYSQWLGAALQGDWGTSLSLRRPATAVILERVPATVLLVVSAVALEHLLGILLGVFVARRPGGLCDHGVRWSTLLLHAVPSFLLALVLLEIFAVRLDWLPIGGMTSDQAAALSPLGRGADRLAHLVLPVLALALLRFGAVVRFVRNRLLDVLSQDFVLAARARGLSEQRILWRHALPHTFGPLIERLGVSLPALLGGTVVLEVIFAWPGLGRTVYSATLQRDYPVILAATVFSAALVVAGNLAADLAHGWLDPRVRERRAG